MKRLLEGKTGLLLLLLLLVALFSKNFIIKVALKNYGTCVYGVLTSETIRETRARSSSIVYQIVIKGKTYEGASDITDPDFKRKGEKICILYLSSFPFIHRPVSFFEEPVNCNCK